ncbi:MAG TPA: aminotransferase class I/II-fold pyridoxal phosphate-dependent enzyme [Gemmatimonadaceae bacterium]|nr:aminotransferase class I/II-fold pyridoxal phosphate-dependent enzyme [Gemmatimonadaceae bacterium]
MPPFSARLLSLPEYPLAAIPGRKRELLARGVDVIDLGAGDADLPPSPAAVERMRDAVLRSEMSRYGFALGLPEFREAIVQWMQRRFSLSFDPFTEVVPLIGSKEGIAHLALAYLERGDLAIMPEPGYLAYLGGTLLSEAEPYRYTLRRDNGFLIDLSDIPEATLRRAKLLYLNYPGNPTGAVAPREYLQRVVDSCRDLDLLLVYDNAYSELAFDGYVPPSIFEIEGARDVAIEFHSLSKTYNMTGWRCGWAVSRPEIAGALSRVKSFVDTGSFLGVQAAAAAALDSWETFVPRNVEIFRERRDAAVAAFMEAGFECNSPLATMYLWVPLPPHVASAAFAERLLEEGVVVLPGSAFGEGGEGYFRVSFIAPPDRIREGARRAGRVLAGFGAPVS